MRLDVFGLYTRSAVRAFKTFRGAQRYARRAHLSVYWQGGPKGWTAVRHRQLYGDHGGKVGIYN